MPEEGNSPCWPPLPGRGRGWTPSELQHRRLRTPRTPPGTDVPVWPTEAGSAMSPAALRRALPIADPGRGLTGTDPATLPLAAPESKEEGQDHSQGKVI